MDVWAKKLIFGFQIRMKIRNVQHKVEVMRGSPHMVDATQRSLIWTDHKSDRY